MKSEKEHKKNESSNNGDEPVGMEGGPLGIEYEVEDVFAGAEPWEHVRL